MSNSDDSYRASHMSYVAWSTDALERAFAEIRADEAAAWRAEVHDARMGEWRANERVRELEEECKRLAHQNSGLCDQLWAKQGRAI